MKLPKVTTELQLRFVDIDLLGHVSNAVYPQYFDLGRIDFFLAIGGKERPPVSVVRRMEYDMLKEITLMDKPVLETWCADRSNKTLTIKHRIMVNGECAVEGATLLVGFDEETRKSCPFPDHWEVSGDD